MTLSPSLPQKPSLSSSKKFTRALIFTIDSIDSYVKNRKSGPSGEILVRESLQRSFDLLNVKYDLVRSDQEANLVKPEAYDFFVLDPWTWAGKVLAPKSFLLGNERKVFILDYLGAGGSQLNSRRSDSSLASRVPADRFLTAYGLDPAHAFLGFSMAPAVVAIGMKKNQGVIWGKSSSFLIRHMDLLSQVADVVELHSTCSVEVLKHPNIHWHGSLSDTDWMMLLKESKFLLGLGDPVLGPSVIDAVASGVVYINPVYAEPRMKNDQDTVPTIHSQHPYAETRIGSPYVCNYREDSVLEALSCIKYAVTSDVAPFVPTDFTPEAHLARVKKIFQL